MMSSYLDQIHRNLPRLLASYDTDKSSDTYGVGDRYYWGWKLIDFPNGTFQAAAAGLAGLLVEGLLPDSISEESILQRIEAIVFATRRVMSRNGSLAEALPDEGSFCVTGLVAGDLLLALDRLSDRLSMNQKQEWLSVVEPLIEFLSIQDEYHGVISNHLATNALALVRWSDLGDYNTDDRARLWVDRILSHQSGEGWFKEYDGPDAGYQTWCTSSLAAIHRLRPQWGLREPLKKSLDFLSYAAHPDGSFGGIYGSRMTRFIFPSGLEHLSQDTPMARALANFSRGSIGRQSCVTLDAIDPPNLVPLFNDYVTAAILVRQHYNQEDFPALPCYGGRMRTLCDESGWLVDRGDSHYLVLNLRKGGAGIHAVDGEAIKEITGFVGRNHEGRLFSTQFLDDDASWSLKDGSFRLTSNLRTVRRLRPNAFRFVILRLMSLTLLRSVWVGNWIKRALVYLLVTGKTKSIGQVVRLIKPGKTLIISDEHPDSIEPVDAQGFKPIHMASMGYWQRGE